MNKMPRMILEASNQFDFFVKKSQQMSAQPSDIKASVASALGLVKDGSDYKFETSSKTADIIFNAMDAVEYKGTVTIDLTVDSKKTGTLTVTCSPSNTKIPTIISSKLTQTVNNALKKMSLVPAETITIKEIVSAWNQ